MKVITRMGDGTLIEMSEDELRQDLEDGTQDAAERGEIATLSGDELAYLLDIFRSPDRFVSVEPGNEIVLSYDDPMIKIARLGVISSRVQSLQMYEKMLGADTIELGQFDYTYKALKNLMPFEKVELEQTLLLTTIPLLYGAMPNLGAYTQPDGPFPNPVDLLPKGKIAEARASLEGMVEAAIPDIVGVATAMYQAGADGINIDTTGAVGDADFLASLRAAAIIKKKYPGVGIEIGMAGEFVLGMHGGLTYEGVRLAGLYPHQQVELAAKAGATIFGPAINTNTKKSCAWNVARATTFVKACVEKAEIPVHANIGMGVGGIPCLDQPPLDAVSRASKAMVEITKLDGL